MKVVYTYTDNITLLTKLTQSIEHFGNEFGRTRHTCMERGRLSTIAKFGNRRI